MPSKTLHYKSARLLYGEAGQNLQQLVNKALAAKSMAKDRKQEVWSNTYRLINFFTSHENMLFGEIFDYTKGREQEYTNLAGKGKYFSVDATPPPDKSEFVDSILYFGILQNHVVVLQTRTLRARQLEEHLNWLLQETKSCTDKQRVFLTDQPHPDLADKMGETKGLEFSSPVQFLPKNNNDEDALPTSKVNTPKENASKILGYIPIGKGWEAIKGMLPPEILPEKINLDDIIQNRQLMVKLEVSWQRPRGDEASTILDTISSQLRHVETDLDYQIKTKSGATISKKQIKLNTSVEIGIDKRKRLKREEVWDRIHRWVHSLVGSGRVVSE